MVCGREGDWVCSRCFDKIEFINTPICFKCGKLSPNFEVCSVCKRKHSLKRVITCAHWQDPAKTIVYQLKYRKIFAVADKLGALMAVNLHKYKPMDAVLVPVPLHKFKLWQRGFNQSEHLANEVHRYLNISVCNCLARVKNTRPQFGLDKNLRPSNVAGAFCFVSKFKNSILGKRVILIDDVVATGSTISECAKVLKQAGAREVWGLILAKA